jgi:hypothetical protein
MQTSTKTILLCTAILFGGILFAAWAVAQILKFPPPVIVSLTEAFLKAGFAVAVLGVAFFRRWINVKNTVIVTAVLSVGLSVWVTAEVQTAASPAVSPAFYHDSAFSAEFPCDVKVKTSAVPNTQESMHLYECTSVGITYSVTYLKVAEPPPIEDAIKAGLDGAMSPGYTVTMSETTLDGMTATSGIAYGFLKVRPPDQQRFEDWTLGAYDSTSQRIWLLQIVAPANQADHEMNGRFFGSFKRAAR